jgi:hypothetical protein
VAGNTLQAARHLPCLGLSALGGAMTYEKPEVRDFGSIAEHTYVDGDFGGCSGYQYQGDADQTTS